MHKDVFVRACREGGAPAERALTALYQDYGPALWRDAARMLRDAEGARDLLQDTLIKAWRACAGYRGESELFPWLQRILRRSAIDQLRRGRLEVAFEDEQGVLSPEVESAWTEWRADLHSEPASALQGRQSEAVYRRCAERFAAEEPQASHVIRWIAEEDLTPAEVAPLIGRSAGATREYISQCRKKARHYFAEWYALVASADAREAREADRKRA